MRRAWIIPLALLFAGCADGDVQSTFFSGGLSDGDGSTGGSSSTSTGSDASAASEATMINPTVGLSTGQTGSTSGTVGSATANPTDATSSGVGPETTAGSGSSGTPADDETCTAAELELIDLVNAYRMQNGLPAVPVNEDLCAVAHTHAVDLAEQGPQNAAGCGLRSWSNAGVWSACCYTEDLAEVQCMWDKPRELTSYTGNGLEVVAESTDPAGALSMMQAETYGNAIMLNSGIWDDFPWRSVGASIHGGFALVWFGPDPP